MSEKKHKGGYELLKEKYDALKKEKEILVQTAQENYCRLEQECKKNKEIITELTTKLELANGNLEATNVKHKRQMEEMYRAMGPLRRWWWDLHHLPVFDTNEHWH